ncbi:uncharacterized protein LOC134820365 [Bolinopsis microptera]|uniref:uncharacterized protein LOC134820365 n=1 Tax=Bolinopsis microptera TaxID=2820187 RepID=UPI00307908E4
MRLGFLLVSLAIITLDVYSAQTIKAGCTMKKHGSGEEIGRVLFMKEGTNKYTVVARLRSDEETVKTGEHGFHVHTNGVDETMDSWDCGTTGGHFNPEVVNHGCADCDVRHVGDFANIKSGEDNQVKFKAIFTVESGDVLEKRRPEGRQWYSQSNGAKIVRYTVKEAPFEMTGLHGIIGKGVVLHDNPDDLGLSENNGASYSGNAGSRKACCTLENLELGE